MPNQTFTKETLGLMSLIESLTKAKIKDLFFSDKLLTLIVQPGDAGKAIGKSGKNLAMIQRIIKKPIKVIEFNNDPVEFTKNILFPIKPDSIQLHENAIILSAKSNMVKGKIFGRDKSNLKYISMILERCCSKQVIVV